MQNPRSLGFVSFILVFVSISLLLILLRFQGVQINLSKAIAVEQAYYLQMNAKEAVLEAARSGSQEGLKQYLAELAISGSKFNIDSAYSRARAEAHRRMALLDNFWSFESSESFELVAVPDFETRLWCGYTDSIELESIKLRMLQEGTVLSCNGCDSISSFKCIDFVNFVPQPDFLSINSFYLEGRSPFYLLKHGVVGVSVYSKKFNVSGVSYIPPSKHIEVKII
ncbi:TPA: hypothetical protein HA238_05310 [Candidatus Micrarchaeota archaeon]|nr:hypothetical protein [Candidatus Micrarchaeota archaeon]